MLSKLGFVTIPQSAELPVGTANSISLETKLDESSAEIEETIEETDPDVLSLPSIESIAQYLQIDIPKKLKQKTEIYLKRAIISCLDSFEPSNVDKLAVEDVISSAGENTPGVDIDIRRLRAALAEVATEFDSVLKLESDKVKKLGRHSLKYTFLS